MAEAYDLPSEQVLATAGGARALVVPGRFFDDGSRFRVSLAGEPTAMADALAALGRVSDSH
ncbi:MAG: hypothetical protein V5A44_06150 [Haloarculaceae archaeon]